MVAKSPLTEGSTVHRSTLKQSNKPHKGSKKKGGAKGHLKTPVVKVNVLTTRQERKHHGLQLKQVKTGKVKHAQIREKESSIPKLIAVIPFHPSVDMALFASSFVKYVSLEILREQTASRQLSDQQLQELEAQTSAQCDELIQKSGTQGIITLPLPSWAAKRRRKLQFIFGQVPCAAHDAPLDSVMSLHLEHLDICKAADGILGVFGTTSNEPGTVEPRAFSKWGYDFLSLLRKQGIPPIFGVASQWADASTGQQWMTQTAKQRAANLDMVKRCFETEVPNGVVFDVCQMMASLQQLDAKTFWSSGFQEIPRKAASELINLIRHIAEVNLGSFSWREESCGYLISEVCQVDEISGSLAVLGYVRGLGFSCRCPAHITGLGDFPIERISWAPQDTSLLSAAAPQFVVAQELQDRDSFLRIWAQDACDQSLEAITAERDAREDEEIMEDDESVENHDVDVSDVEDDGDSETEEWIKSLLEDASVTETGRPTQGFQERTRNEMEFPDEVDTPSDVPCRVKFIKYRGLRNFKNSKWDMDADRLPEWYSRIIEFNQYKHFMKQIRAKTANILGELKALPTKADTSFALLTLKIPDELKEGVIARLRSSSAPLIVSSLGLVERKVSVQHFACAKTNEAERAPIPSKSRFLIQCGFRRFEACPIFSASKVKGNPLPTEVGDPSGHKLAYRRYLPEEDRHLYVASFVGPTVQVPNAPMLGWLLQVPSKLEAEITEKCEGEELPLPVPFTPVLSGHFVTTDPNRLIIKRILLTGYPHRIKKKACSVRRMFFNREDVQFYSPIHLFARSSSGGRQKEGRIKEPLGTHGDMKCLFSEPLNHSETVCLPLYRRVVPPCGIKP